MRVRSSRSSPEPSTSFPTVARELGDGLVQELDVELEADGRNVTRLLGTEQLAGAADLEIAHRDREAGAKLRMVGQGREAGTRLRGQLARVRIEEVRVCG